MYLFDVTSIGTLLLTYNHPQQITHTHTYI